MPPESRENALEYTGIQSGTTVVPGRFHILYISTVIIAVKYPHLGRDIRVHFAVPGVCLPVRTRSGGVQLVTWGRREGEPGEFPLGCCARLEAIQAGEWDYWFPIPVQLPLTQLLERNSQGRGVWSCPLVRGHRVQGLVARDGLEQRVYVVTIPAPDLPDVERVPRVITVLS